MYTRHPACTSPDAIIAPIPLDPPVTTATLPLTENRFPAGCEPALVLSSDTATFPLKSVVDRAL